MVLKELLEQRDKAAKELREIEDALKLEKPEKLEDGTERTERDLTPEEEQRSNALLEEVDDLDEQIQDETRRQLRSRLHQEARELVTRSDNDKTDAKVVDEPMQYGKHSFFADLVRLSAGPMWGGTPSGAAERMANWAHQVEREVAHDSERGREAMVQLRGMENVREHSGIEAHRYLNEVRERGRASLESKQTEVRAGITTGGGATASASGGGGAAFVIPVFYEQDYAPYREAGRAFADAVNKRPLPPYGMTVYIPAITGPAAVAQQVTEGAGIAETDPTAGFISGGLITT